MQPALNDDELENLYPNLTPEQRTELEGWHRDWIEKMMLA